MKKWQGTLLLLLAVILIVLIIFIPDIAESENKKFSDYSFEFFDTVTSITGYAENKDEFENITGFIFSELERYHKLYNIYYSYSDVINLKDINEVIDGHHNKLHVSNDITDMLLFARDIYDLSGGKMNVAFGSVLSIWHEYREEALSNPENAQIPAMSLLKEAANYTDFDSVLIDNSSSSVQICEPHTKLDVGAIAKGYALEKIAESLYEMGISGYCINIGGNIRTIGARGDNSPWLIGIENPEDNDNPYLAKVALSDMAIATSGNYQRFYEINGKKYHHIIDTATLMPADIFTSVTVISDDAGLSDGLSTVLFCLNFEDGLKLVEELDGVEAMWLKDTGELLYSSHFSDFFVK